MIGVCTTLAAFAMHDRDTWAAWLNTAEQLAESHDDGVRFFAAIEVDARGITPFEPLLDRLDDLNGDYWTYQLDDGRTTVSTLNRLRHITMGQNLCADWATAEGASHMLFMAADCQPPADSLPKLLEVAAPVVGGYVPTYCLHGEPTEQWPFPAEVQPTADEYCCTAAFMLIDRQTFKRLKWRYDPDTAQSDDPCYQWDAFTMLGTPSIVRMDVQGKHFPEAIGAVETRYPGRDMSVAR